MSDNVQFLSNITEIIINFQNMSQEICRICLQKGSRNNFIALNVGHPSLKEKLTIIAPEMNLNIISEPAICGPCSATLENTYQFKIRCLRSEETIWSHVNIYAGSKSLTAPVKLIDLLPVAELSNLREEAPSFNFYHNQNSPTQTLHNFGDKQCNIEINSTKNVCGTCKQSFNTKDELLAHIPTHLGTRPFMCSLCYKCFSLRSNLNIHMRTHTQDKPYTCEFCPKTFTTKGNLITHVRVHTKEKPFLCSICDKNFTQKIQLSTHMLLHANDQLFACNVCNKSFSSKSTLKIHTRIHEEIKPFLCDYCDKCFTTKGNLVIHTRTHTGEKPYTCVECGQNFMQQGQLKLHLKWHKHPNNSGNESMSSASSSNMEHPACLLDVSIDDNVDTNELDYKVNVDSNEEILLDYKVNVDN